MDRTLVIVEIGVNHNGDSQIKRGTFVGSNTTISNGITVDENSVISTGKFIK